MRSERATKTRSNDRHRQQARLEVLTSFRRGTESPTRVPTRGNEIQWCSARGGMKSQDRGNERGNGDREHGSTFSGNDMFALSCTLSGVIGVDYALDNCSRSLGVILFET